MESSLAIECSWWLLDDVTIAGPGSKWLSVDPFLRSCDGRLMTNERLLLSISTIIYRISTSSNPTKLSSHNAGNSPRPQVLPPSPKSVRLLPLPLSSSVLICPLPRGSHRTFSPVILSLYPPVHDAHCHPTTSTPSSILESTLRDLRLGSISAMSGDEGDQDLVRALSEVDEGSEGLDVQGTRVLSWFGNARSSFPFPFRPELAD
jgi:hypothetical protein